MTGFQNQPTGKRSDYLSKYRDNFHKEKQDRRISDDELLVIFSALTNTRLRRSQLPPRRRCDFRPGLEDPKRE